MYAPFVTNAPITLSTMTYNEFITSYGPVDAAEALSHKGSNVDLINYFGYVYKEPKYDVVRGYLMLLAVAILFLFDEDMIDDLIASR